MKIFILLALFILASTAVFASAPGLRSMETISVQAPTLGPDAVRIGLDAETIRATMEKQLQDAGFHLGTGTEEYPRLELSVIAMKPFAGYVVTYRLRVVDWVRSKRNEGLSFTATVWDQGTMFSSTKKDVQKKSDPALKKLTDTFITDFRKENPLF